MLLRLLVAHFVRQAAEQKLRGAMEEMVREQSGADRSGSDESIEPLPPCEIALLFASSLESGGSVDQLKNAKLTRCPGFVEHTGLWRQRNVVLAECGEGAERVAQATRDLINFYHPSWIVSAGFAASLNSDLTRSTVVLADELCDDSGAKLQIGLSLSDGAQDGFRVGRLLTASSVLRTKKEREDAAARSGAVAADCESMHAAAVCAEHKTRFLAVRIVTDELDDEIPREIRNLENQSTWAGRLGAVTGALINKPGTLKSLWGLRQQALEQSDRLAQFLRGFLPQLPS